MDPSTFIAFIAGLKKIIHVRCVDHDTNNNIQRQRMGEKTHGQTYRTPFPCWELGLRRRLVDITEMVVVHDGAASRVAHSRLDGWLYTVPGASTDRRTNKVMRPTEILILRKAEDYTTCIQVDLKQGFQKCSFYREQFIPMYVELFYSYNIQKQVSDTGDTNTHAYRLVALTCKACSGSASALQYANYMSNSGMLLHAMKARGLNYCWTSTIPEARLYTMKHVKNKITTHFLRQTDTATVAAVSLRLEWPLVVGNGSKHRLWTSVWAPDIATSVAHTPRRRLFARWFVLWVQRRNPRNAPATRDLRPPPTPTRDLRGNAPRIPLKSRELLRRGVRLPTRGRGGIAARSLASSPRRTGFRLLAESLPDIRVSGSYGRLLALVSGFSRASPVPPPPPLHSDIARYTPTSTSSALKNIRAAQYSVTTVNTARIARRSDEALGFRVSVARIAPSLLDLGRAEQIAVLKRDSHRYEETEHGPRWLSDQHARLPPRRTGFKWESCRTMPLVGGFSRGYPVSPAPLVRRRSIFTSDTLIGSQDLAVKSRPNLFTHSLYKQSGFSLVGRKNNLIRPLARYWLEGDKAKGAVQVGAGVRERDGRTSVHIFPRGFAKSKDRLEEKQCLRRVFHPLIPNDIPFEFRRLHFPLNARFAMTANKSQGTLASHQGEPGPIPGWVNGFSQARIVPGSAGILGGSPALPPPPPPHSGAAPYSLQSPSSALKTSLLGATRISSLIFHHCSQNI
ncbi:hypothetical protein PR048_022862 [Dryococelus australis]|uniref:Uncharacterized protein n=1 Tax=Dryococelus australis TaxID=614101 RepID=A0ABQ9GSI0_9NEOP|nr:hypothetical protein PR048_022862 [Dryococelus australis]